MHSVVEENYLKAIMTLSRDAQEVNVHELSSLLNIKMPSVTSMMKKLAAKGLVHYERYRPIRLTHEGRREAALIVRKHRLTEMFLVQVMGFGWEEVHDIAEQIEHIQSPIFFAKMDEILKYPTVDPHGSPIPNREGDIAEVRYDTLSDREVGDRVRVTAVTHSGEGFLTFLNARAIHIGTILTVLSIESFDHSMMVTYEGHDSEMLSQIVCDGLLVEEVR